MQPVPVLDPAFTEGGPDLDGPELPGLMVSMSCDHVVICPPRHLDQETTHILIIAAASAIRAGSNVMIDLDPDTASDDLIPLGPVIDARIPSVTSAGGPVRVLGPGCVRLATRDSHWTIDFGHRRLFRADTAVEPCFVSPDGWTRIRALWVTCATVTALSTDGTYLTTRSAWTSEPA